MRANSLLHSWDDFLHQVHLRFHPDHIEDYVGALSKLRQRPQCWHIKMNSSSCSTRLRGVTESTLLSVFISGLKPTLRHELNLRRPITLTTAFAIARELSALHANSTSTYNNTLRPWHSTSQSKTTTTASLEVQRPLSSSPHSAQPDLPVRRLSYAEKQANDAQGLCYNCDKKWSRTHRCQSRLLLHIGDADEDDPNDDVELTHPSLDETTLLADISSLHSLS